MAWLCTGSFAKLPIGEPLDVMAARAKRSIGFFPGRSDLDHIGLTSFGGGIWRNNLRSPLHRERQTVAVRVAAPPFRIVCIHAIKCVEMWIIRVHERTFSDGSTDNPEHRMKLRIGRSLPSKELVETRAAAMRASSLTTVHFPRRGQHRFRRRIAAELSSLRRDGLSARATMRP